MSTNNKNPVADAESSDDDIPVPARKLTNILGAHTQPKKRAETLTNEKPVKKKMADTNIVPQVHKPANKPITVDIQDILERLVNLDFDIDIICSILAMPKNAVRLQLKMLLFSHNNDDKLTTTIKSLLEDIPKNVVKDTPTNVNTDSLHDDILKLLYIDTFQKNNPEYAEYYRQLSESCSTNVKNIFAQ